MNLDQWDKEVSPYLQEMQINAGWIGFYARKTAQVVKEMAYKAPFDTLAEEALKDTSQQLIEVASLLMEARKQYLAKKEVA